jgi:hypothetical protein
MAVTIEDVAMQAGVSTATVSRVLNKPSKVSEHTRERVKLVIDLLGYRVNVAAASLSRHDRHKMRTNRSTPRNSTSETPTPRIADRQAQLLHELRILKDENRKLRLLVSQLRDASSPPN